MIWFAIHGLGLATINLCTKFEVSNSVHYEDMKGDTECGKWGSYGSLEVTGNSAIWQTTYEFLLAYNSNYVPNLHRLWDIVSYWSKITDFNLPHPYLVPRLGVAPLKFRWDFWHQ